MSFKPRKNFSEVVEMTIAERLYAIANISDKTQRKKEARSFMEQICNHTDEKILRACLKRAELGQAYISFGRNIFVPENLKEEGFWIQVDGSGFLLSFAPKSEI